MVIEGMFKGNAMPRARKDGKYINLRIDRKLYERFEKYCTVEARTKTAALERMISAYLEQYEKHSHERRTIYD